MTLDTAKISELVVFKAEILLGIPEKRLYFRSLAVCFQDSGSFPPDLIGGEVDRISGKLFVVIAYQDSHLVHSLEVYRFGEHLLDALADPDLSECHIRDSGGKLSDLNVLSQDCDISVGLEPGNPAKAVASEETDEFLGTIPAIEEPALDFKAEP